MKKAIVICIALAVFLLAGCGAKTEAPSGGENPFFVEWTTPYGVPPFDEIKEEHFLPAYEAAIAVERKAIEAIAANPDDPTFDNTIGALDGVGTTVGRVGGVFGTLAGAATNENIQAIAKEVAPLQSNLRDDMLMNPQLFARVKAVYEQRDELGLDAEQMTLVGNIYRNFVRGGAELSEDEKERVREINSRLSTLGLTFGDNVLAETNDYKLFIDDEKDLAGLPAGVVQGAADAAAEAGHEGQWLFTVHRPSIYPFLDYAENRELREKLYTAYVARGNNGNEHDNKEILSEILVLRAEKSKMLGYDTHADFILDERMAKNPEAVYEFLDDLWYPSLAVAREEAEILQAAIEADGFDFKLEPWDWRYYAEKVRQTRYEVDEQEIRPYFMIDNVIDGAFAVANKLYGIEFEERTDIPKYHPEVRTYVVTDADGSHLGVFMADYHPRPSKQGGAWSGNIRGQWVQDGQEIRPIVTNVGNFSRAAGDVPALLSLEEVHTLFHELGHGLHSLLSDVRYRGSADVKWDFVELPSQIMENWLLESEVLELYAKHYETGRVIPDELLAKIEAGGQFNQGFTSVEYLSACYLDMDLHTEENPAGLDVVDLENASMARIGLIPEIGVRYSSTFFGHIVGGYSAGYYSYIWAEVLDADAYQAFKETSLFDQEVAMAFRTNILERGGAEDPEILYRRFRGRDPSVEPLLARRGLK